MPLTNTHAASRTSEHFCPQTRVPSHSAVSKEAPSFFHIRGVPRARGKSGGLAFDYDSGKWDVGRVLTGDTRPRTSAMAVPRASRWGRKRTLTSY